MSASPGSGQNTKQSQTVYLRNLPRRPASEDTFTRLLLASVNPDNKFAKDHDLPLPHIDLKLLPKDNRKVVFDKLDLDRATLLFEATENSLLSSQALDSDEVLKPVLTDFFNAIASRYKGSFDQLTTSKFRSIYKSLKAKEEFEKIDRLLGLKSKLKTLEHDICIGSMACIPTLDSKYGIVALSRTGCWKYQNQGFLTFVDSEKALSFVNTFKGKLKIRGHRLAVSLAEKDSMLGAYLQDGKRSVDSMLNNKDKRKTTNKLQDQEAEKLKRRARRLRGKLLSKGMPVSEISEIVNKRLKQHKTHSDLPTKRPGTSLTEPVTKKKKVVAEVAANPPNKILLVQNLPSGVSNSEVVDLFRDEGFVEVRLVGVRNLAFVEYETISNATNVKNNMGSSYDWNGSTLSIGFAR